MNKHILYNNLLEKFANDLNGKGIILIMISVNKQLILFPNIKIEVDELSKKRCMRFIDIDPWFRNVTDYGTPEGHIWGKKAHFIIGNNLSDIILDYAEENDRKSYK
ncbi:MAG: hypothetical protein P8X58_08670 [Syntrophobacterales bacterium]